MPIMDYMYLDTPASAEDVRTVLINDMGFKPSEDPDKRGYAPWLVSGRGLVIVEPLGDDGRGPHTYPQPATLKVLLNYNNQKGAFEYLAQVAGNLLHLFPGNAVLHSEGGGTVLLRRGDTVWVKPDPFHLEHLFSGSFRPAKLICGLPPPEEPGKPAAETEP